MSQHNHGDPISLTESLERLRAHMGTAAPSAISTLQDSWTQLIGARLASSCTLGAVRGATLVVHASDPAVAEQLGWMHNELVAAANELLGVDQIASVETRVVTG